MNPGLYKFLDRKRLKRCALNNLNIFKFSSFDKLLRTILKNSFPIIVPLFFFLASRIKFDLWTHEKPNLWFFLFDLFHSKKRMKKWLIFSFIHYFNKSLRSSKFFTANLLYCLKTRKAKVFNLNYKSNS